MKKTAMTETILKAKADKNMGWEQIAEKTGLAPVFTTSACLGMNSMPKENADKLCTALSLPAEVSAALQEYPHKRWDKLVPTDPVIYRLYEIIGVYGETIKQIIHEKFGDGIMSAIDFSMHIEKVPDPKGDRVKVTMNGSSCPTRSGDTANAAGSPRLLASDLGCASALKPVPGKLILAPPIRMSTGL